MAAPVAGNRQAGVEGAQVEGGEVEQPLRLRVRRVEQLEAAVEPEPVDDVGADPAAHGLGRLDDHGVGPCLLEPDGRGQPGEPGTHDDDVGTPGQRHASNLVDPRGAPRPA